MVQHKLNQRMDDMYSVSCIPVTGRYVKRAYRVNCT